MTTVAALTAAVQAAQNPAATVETLAAASIELLGWSLAEDQPEADAAELADQLLDHVSEICYAEGIHTTTVGMNPLAGWTVEIDRSGRC